MYKIQHLFKIGKPRKFIDPETQEVKMIDEVIDQKYHIENLQTLTITQQGYFNTIFTDYSQHYVQYVEQIIKQIEGLPFPETTLFIEFHFSRLTPTSKREFLTFLSDHILNNPGIIIEKRSTLTTWHIRQSESLKTFSEENPLMNWKNFVWQLEAFLLNCSFLEDTFLEINEEIGNTTDEIKLVDLNNELLKIKKDHRELVKREVDKLRENEIFNLCHRAKQELEKEIVVKNNPVLQRSIEAKLNDLSKDIDELIKVFKMDNARNGYRFTFIEIVGYFDEINNWFSLNFTQEDKNNEDSLVKINNKGSSKEVKEGIDVNLFKNNFDMVNCEVVVEHFRTGLVDNKMMNEDELMRYLKAAFDHKMIPNELFNIKNAQSKDKVMKVFYEYYKNIAGKPHGKQQNYAALLGDYFQGYKTSTVSTNFSKSIY